MNPQIEPSWKSKLGNEFSKPYMQDLRAYLIQEKQDGKRIFPPGSLWFEAFNRTPFDKVRVVILGQDPYHGPGQAHGLCFSVLDGTRLPPSLINIYKELVEDEGIKPPTSGDLSPWADQGVLLLNATLTVEAFKAGSHQKKGWEEFTDRAIAHLNEEREGLVFMLWGSYAQKKGQSIDTSRHLVLRAPHPSPLSAHRGFLGCKHFSQANDYLQSRGLKPIDWQIP
ncbi:MAG: uracil-DNA glycosylase [Pseudomonadales bacterium]